MTQRLVTTARCSTSAASHTCISSNDQWLSCRGVKQTFVRLYRTNERNRWDLCRIKPCVFPQLPAQKITATSMSGIPLRPHRSVNNNTASKSRLAGGVIAKQSWIQAHAFADVIFVFICLVAAKLDWLSWFQPLSDACAETSIKPAKNQGPAARLLPTWLRTWGSKIKDGKRLEWEKWWMTKGSARSEYKRTFISFQSGSFVTKCRL